MNLEHIDLDGALCYRWTCTAVPVQAEGTLAGFPFYFRARWDSWRFAVTTDGTSDPVQVAMDDLPPFTAQTAAGFACGQPYGEPGGYAAGWMDLPEAAGFLRAAAHTALQAIGPVPIARR